MRWEQKDLCCSRLKKKAGWKRRQEESEIGMNERRIFKAGIKIELRIQLKRDGGEK